MSGRSIEVSGPAVRAPDISGRGTARRRAALGVRRDPRRQLLGRAFEFSARIVGAPSSKSHPGTLLEDKGRAIAVHFRLAPAFESDARRAVDAAAGPLGADYHVQEGKMVFEIKPRGFTKATAAEEFMREPPFAGRTPVFVGDDLTDEAGFRAVEALGGISDRRRRSDHRTVALGEPGGGARWLAIHR